MKAGGEDCPLVTAWQSWIHLENFSAYHDVPFASKDNGFAGLDTELMLNGLAQVAHLLQWVIGQKKVSLFTLDAEMKVVPTLEPVSVPFTESSAGYAGISAE